jgi:hypothetical protein
MEIVEEHQSPDALLKFIVVRADDGDIDLGFEGFAWHTHANLLVPFFGNTENIAIRTFVDSVLSNRAIIAVVRVDGKLQDVSVTDIARPGEAKSDRETVEFRYWDGSPVL